MEYTGPSGSNPFYLNGTVTVIIETLNMSFNQSETTTMTKPVAAYSLTPYGDLQLWITSIVLGLVILGTIVGNSFVIAAILLERNLQSPQNYLVMSLAVADLMVAALVMPLALLDNISKHWFLGSEICDVWIFFDVMCCTSSILHLVCIAIDRYWAVTRVDYVNNRSVKRIGLMIFLSWLISACVIIPPLFGWKDAGNDPEISGTCIISQDLAYTLYSTGLAFYIPLFFIIVIYLKVYKAAKSRIRKKHIKAYRDLASNIKPLITASNINGQVSITFNTIPPTEEGFEDDDGGIALSPITSSQQSNPVNGLPITFSEDSVSVRAARNNNKDRSPNSPAGDLIVTDNRQEGDQSTKNSATDLRKAFLLSPRRKQEIKNPREKLESKRERKAARTLAIITGTFIACWLPFFIVAVVRPFCGDNCSYPWPILSIITWLGYLNSLLNPIIYTIFSTDFRNAFKKILFNQYKRNNH